MCVCMCVCARARARTHTHTHTVFPSTDAIQQVFTPVNNCTNLLNNKYISIQLIHLKKYITVNKVNNLHTKITNTIIEKVLLKILLD